jgi:parvulin-like peptidyl-prolyl isomerase
MKKHQEVFVSDFGTYVVPVEVLIAYGVDTPPKSKDRRRKDVKEYWANRRTMESNLRAVIEHNWIMGMERTVF